MIYEQAAYIRNNSIIVMLFPAREFYGRLRDLESNCKIARFNNPKLVTQIRYGEKDLILMTKNRDEKKYIQRDIYSYGDIQNVKITKRKIQTRDAKKSPPKGRVLSY